MNIFQTGIFAAVFSLGVTSTMLAQSFDPPPPKMPDEKTLELIQHRTIKLRDAVEKLPKTLPDHLRADVEIYLNGKLLIARPNFLNGYQQHMLTPEEKSLLQEGTNTIAAGITVLR